MNKSWSSQLAPGDMVFRHGARWQPPTSVEVTRVTKTQVILADGSRWRRDTGDRVGRKGGWIDEWTDEREAKYATERAAARDLARVRSVRWHEIPTDTIARILSILDEPRESECVPKMGNGARDIRCSRGTIGCLEPHA